MIVDTLPKALLRSVEQHADKPALLVKREREYHPITYRELYRRIYACARGLHALGVRGGDRVAILAENCAEWAITDWANLCMGALTVPIYPTLTAAQVAEILRDAEPTAMLVSDKRQLRKAGEALEQAGLSLQLISLQPDEKGETTTFEELLQMPGELTESQFQQIACSIEPDEVATLIYTSGTTGEPKGAMLTHRNFISNIEGCLQVIELNPNEVLLSFLPLSHVFERTCGHFLPIYTGLTIAYAESLFTLAADMVAVRPTLMLGVPRFFESVRDRILSSVRQQTPTKQKLFERALAVGKEVSRCWREGRPCPLTKRLAHRLLDRLVGEKIRARTGGRLRLFISGGAALPKEIAEFFHAFGILILEGYGLTETSPVLTANPPHAPRFGSVGKPLSGVEIRIAEDGEIVARGPNIMKGYYKKLEATAAVIDSNGWFHTGDIGYMDEQGYLYITDRKKDIIVLANGKNVAPQRIENLLRTSPYIQEAVVFGDGMSAPVALLVPDMELLKQYAQQHELDTTDIHTLLEHDLVQRLYRQEIERVNRELADFEKVKAFRLLSSPFTVESGELTPTLKVKRRVVAQKYAALLQDMAR
jgi:long-chain acyl-CoA synthetase